MTCVTTALSCPTLPGSCPQAAAPPQIQSSTVRTGTKAFHAKVADKTTGTTGARQTTNTLAADVNTPFPPMSTPQNAPPSWAGRLPPGHGRKHGGRHRRECLNYATNSAIDGGWVRLSLPFLPRLRRKPTPSASIPTALAEISTWTTSSWNA